MNLPITEWFLSVSKNNERNPWEEDDNLVSGEKKTEERKQK